MGQYLELKTILLGKSNYADKKENRDWTRGSPRWRNGVLLPTQAAAVAVAAVPRNSRLVAFVLMAFTPAILRK